MPGSHAFMTYNDTKGKPILTIETKMGLGTTPEWAAKMRRNLITDGWLSQSPFFLLALPDRFYLWKDAPYNGEAIEPSYIIDPAPLLSPYYTQLGLKSPPYTETGFQMVLFNLFGQSRQRTDILLRNVQKAAGLAESGLLEALAAENIDIENAA